MASSHFFALEPLGRFSGVSPGIRRPKEVTCFSFDDEHNYRWDDSSLRYYYPPTLPADLNRGFDTFRHLDDTRDDHLDGLLDTIALYERQNGTRVETDIVTWRGMMTKIMTTPFSRLESWEMNATCFQGSIFIEEDHASKLASKQQQSQQRMPPGAPSQDLMSFWGYKFETLSLIPDFWHPTARSFIETREDQIVDNHAQYCSIVRTGFGKVKIIIGGEVDAVWDRKPNPSAEPDNYQPHQPINYVELKTAALPQPHPPPPPSSSSSSTTQPPHDPNLYATPKITRKLLKFWAQSFLLGVPKIIVGFRTAGGTLVQLDELDTQGIPDMVKRNADRTPLWDGNVCVGFTAAFLEWLKSIVKPESEDGGGAGSSGVWRIRKRERIAGIEVFKIDDTGHGGILSEKFVRWRTEAREAEAEV